MSKKNQEAKHGKQNNQKMKPYLVMQYLLKYSDENHTFSAVNICDYLKEDCGIYAERRSIYRDVDDINKMNLVLEEDYTMEEAEEILANDEYDEEKLVLYNKHKKVFMSNKGILILMTFGYYQNVFMLQNSFRKVNRNILLRYVMRNSSMTSKLIICAYAVATSRDTKKPRWFVFRTIGVLFFLFYIFLLLSAENRP